MKSKSHIINVRVRLIIIKKSKILLSYVKDEDFYFFIGGKMEYGETLLQTCEREIFEECRAEFEFKKILYVRDYIKPKLNEHSLELYILGDVDKFEEIEGYADKEFEGNHWQTWVDLKRIDKINIRPKSLVEKLLHDYKKGFNNVIGYMGKVD